MCCAEAFVLGTSIPLGFLYDALMCGALLSVSLCLLETHRHISMLPEGCLQLDAYVLATKP